MYYVPSPKLAFDSVRFIMDDLPLGWMLRGLHYWGASFLVVATVVHYAARVLPRIVQGAARAHLVERA
jgi:ubiquinol-cytochrome c reductase cytochrome b subunit